MNVSLPQGAVGDLASSTSSAISSFYGPVVLIIGILLAFYILERVIGSFSGSTTSNGGGQTSP